MIIIMFPFLHNKHNNDSTSKQVEPYSGQRLKLGPFSTGMFFSQFWHFTVKQ